MHVDTALTYKVNVDAELIVHSFSILLDHIQTITSVGNNGLSQSDKYPVNTSSQNVWCYLKDFH